MPAAYELVSNPISKKQAAVSIISVIVIGASWSSKRK
jgi:hypothetical protein